MKPQDLSKEREQACVPVAKEIISILASEPDLMLGEQNPQELQDFYKKLFVEKIEPILRRENIKVIWMSYLFQIMMQPIDNTKMMVVDGVNGAFDLAVAKKFGVSDVDDVRINDIIETQKELSTPTTVVEESKKE